MFAVRGPLHDQDPRQIGPIAILARLGAGGMGWVYEGRDPSGRPVAVKVLRTGDWASDQARTALAREAAVLQTVRSPHVAQLLSSDVWGEFPYLVLELVEGTPLDRIVPDGGFETATVHRIASELLAGLAAAHDVGVVHQDLKPGNVLLCDAGVKIIDFGIAAVADDGTQTALTLSASGGTAGTMAWMAPEQIRGQPATPSSDLFAWGLVVDYAATGRNPFGTGRPETVMYAIVNDEPSIGRLDSAVAGPVLAALAKDPANRATLPQLKHLLTTPLAAKGAALQSRGLDGPSPAQNRGGTTSPARAPTPSELAPSIWFRRLWLLGLILFVSGYLLEWIVTTSQWNIEDSGELARNRSLYDALDVAASVSFVAFLAGGLCLLGAALAWTTKASSSQVARRRFKRVGITGLILFFSGYALLGGSSTYANNIVNTGELAENQGLHDALVAISRVALLGFVAGALALLAWAIAGIWLLATRAR